MLCADFIIHDSAFVNSRCCGECGLRLLVGYGAVGSTRIPRAVNPLSWS